MIGMSDCTPGYYNNEGQPAGPGAKYAVGYPFGDRMRHALPNEASPQGPGGAACADIRRATRKHHSAEDKMRVALGGLRGEGSRDS